MNETPNAKWMAFEAFNLYMESSSILVSLAVCEKTRYEAGIFCIIISTINVSNAQCVHNAPPPQPKSHKISILLYFGKI